MHLTKPSLLAAFALIVLIGATGLPLTRFAEANFMPPLPELPRAYIRSDGSLMPSNIPIRQIGDRYILTANISNLTVEIQRNNVILDGAGFVMDGNGSGRGIVASGANSITVVNLTLRNFRNAMDILNSIGSFFAHNSIENNEMGYCFYNLKNSTVKSNRITSNSEAAMVFSYCDNNSVEENEISQNGAGIWFEFPGSYEGTDDFNRITGNNITHNGRSGILMRGSAKNTIETNTVSYNNQGISLSGSSCNSNFISNNIFESNEKSNISIMADAKYNVITRNTISNSLIGLDVFNSNKSEIYLNNFLGNKQQVSNGFIERDGAILYRANNIWDKAGEGNYWSNRNPANATYVIDESNVDHYPLDSMVALSTNSEPFSIAMPEESVNYTITFRNGALWATIDGSYPMHLTGDLLGLPMIYPTPPNTTNMHVWLNGVELDWGNYSDIDPSAHHLTDIGDWAMIYCIVNPATPNFLLEIHYEHPVEVINGTHMFLYDLNISPYLSSDTPSSTCHFIVKLPQNNSSLKVYTTGFCSKWTQFSYEAASSSIDQTAVFDIVSEYDALVGDIAFVLEDVEIPEFSLQLLFCLFVFGSLTTLMILGRRTGSGGG